MNGLPPHIEGSNSGGRQYDHFFAGAVAVQLQQSGLTRACPASDEQVFALFFDQIKCNFEVAIQFQCFHPNRLI